MPWTLDRRRFLHGSLATGGVAALASLTPLQRARAAEFYAGKSIEIVVPFAEGGVADVGSRFVAPFLSENLPGNPSVSVRNLGGGGSILGANYFEENARGDGEMVLMTTSSTAFPYMFGQQGVAYELSNKRVGLALPIGPVVYGSPALGLNSAADLANARGMIYGGIGATGSDLPVLLAFELLELDLNAVLGFQGRGPVRLAFERGETNLDFQFTAVYLTQVQALVEAGQAVPLMTGGVAGADGRFTERDPVVSDLPSVYEVYVEIFGREPEGPVWEAYQSTAALTFQYGLTGWMHQDTPQEALDAFSAAVAAINQSPTFQARSAEVTGGYSLIDGQSAEGNIKTALDLPEEVEAYLRGLLTDKYGVSL